MEHLYPLIHGNEMFPTLCSANHTLPLLNVNFFFTGLNHIDGHLNSICLASVDKIYIPSVYFNL